MKMFFWGIVVWQIIIFLCFEISRDEDKTLVFSCSMIYLPLKLVVIFLNKIRITYIRKTNVILYIYFREKDKEKNTLIHVARINKRKINKYYNINDNTKHFVTAIYDMKNKYPENVDSLDKVRKNGWWSQEWVNNNLIKKELV